jgi:hypothetical protein
VALGVLELLVIGFGAGALGAALVIALLRSDRAPDYLQSPMSLMLVLLVFTVSNHLHHEAGLLAVTVMGVALANQPWAPVRHIVEFKENLGVLLISVVFILLAARITPSDLSRLDLSAIAYLAALLLVVRPVSVLISTLATPLRSPERLFIAWIAPRGIVAAAVASIFALRLEQIGHPQAGQLVPLVFAVIISTVTLHSLSARPFARALGILQGRPQGLLIVGAHRWARELAALLKSEGFAAVLVDSNRAHVAAARLQGLDAHHANILAEDLPESLDLDGIGRLAALTPNAGVNSLAALHFADVFGRSQVYQLVPEPDDRPGAREPAARHLRGRLLFGEDMTFAHITERLGAGAGLKATNLTDEFDMDALRAVHGPSAKVLFVIDDKSRLTIPTVAKPISPGSGQRVIALVDTELGEDQS